MDRDAIIQAANAEFNRALADGAEPDEGVLAMLMAADADLMNQMQTAFKAAQQPNAFFDESIWCIDERFEMGYELMRLTFEPDVLDPRSAYVEWLGGRTEPIPDCVMIGRYWRVSGRHRYAQDGQLVHFEFDPLVSTESVASVIAASYFSHDSPVLGQQVGVGAISYLATRPALRGKGGHGRHLLEAFEAALHQLAARQNEPLRAIVLESEGRAMGFWSKMGFRCAEGSHYIQPPLSFDPRTGEPISNTAPETFMVKFMDGSSPDCIRRDELLELVHLTYERWYSPNLDTETATARARALVFDELFGVFRDSLPAGADLIPLVPMP